jgi:hypothetical protein
MAHSQSFNQKPERRREQKKRWFGNGQKLAHRIRGSHRRRKADSASAAAVTVGMHRWVGLAIIADNLINIGHAMEKLRILNLSRLLLSSSSPAGHPGGFCLAQRNSSVQPAQALRCACVISDLRWVYCAINRPT